MGVIPSSAVRSATIGTEPQPFWRRIAQALDRLMAQRSQRVVPAHVLRRSKEDIRRCHRLTSQASPIAVRGESRLNCNASNRT
jgi:hypothetical protein